MDSSSSDDYSVSGSSANFRQIYDELAEIKQLVQLRNEFEIYDNRIGVMRTQIRDQTKAITSKEIEIYQLRAEVDLLTQAIHNNEHVIKWLDGVARSTSSDVCPNPVKKSNRILAFIKSVFS